jgi:hypothetical protein
MCFPILVPMLNIYHPHGCHLFQRAEPLCDEALFFFLGLRRVSYWLAVAWVRAAH